MVESGIAVCHSHGFALRNAAGGVVVSRILPGGPADLQKDDTLVSVDGASVATAEAAMRSLEASMLGFSQYAMRKDMCTCARHSAGEAGLWSSVALAIVQWTPK